LDGDEDELCDEFDAKEDDDDRRFMPVVVAAAPIFAVSIFLCC